jgi:DNA-binding response OmpR family regulator
MMCRTLVVEDDPHIADVVEFLLKEEQHHVVRASDGTEGWKRFCRQAFDMVILDLGLPGIPGLDLFQRMREREAEQPILMLTARGEEEERVKGLTLGADDYITKPFSNPELVARIRNVLRRCPPRKSILHCGPFRLDVDHHGLELSGQPVALPIHEFRLLEALLKRTRQTFTREQLMVHMYGPETECNDRTVDQAVTRLRRKISSLLPGENPIRTVYGIGYRFDPSVMEDEI